jgi:hypothetical protein
MAQRRQFFVLKEFPTGERVGREQERQAAKG